ncbi:MAG: NADH dehydrogenase [Bacteroidetes bacterium CG2_30_33_31]|nr:MAG: NADH dehydrogenase [Bacteroidetes bacterium CG2_30_33_31]
MNILSLLILIPTITMIGIIISPSHKIVRLVALGGMIAQLITALVLMFSYFAIRKAGITDIMVFYQDIEWFKTLNIHYIVGVDGISVAMIMLTSVIIFAGILASWEVVYLQKEFFIFLILLATGVFGFFISLDLFTMFLFYEIAVIPMYFLIGIWGTGPKEYSAMKLTLMLMGGSALMMVGLLGLYFNSSVDGHFTFNMMEIAKVNIPGNIQMYFFPFLFVGFGILGALYPFHTWSPDGHASAPTAVSMLHAGVLMKLGGYGAFRVAMYLMPAAANSLSWIFIILATISVVYGAFAVIWQKDLKFINAYASVSHVGLITFALMVMNKTSLDGAIIQMISHGLTTALFFALIGMIYGRTHTRMIDEMGGLIKVIPFLGVAFIIAGLSTLGLPGLSGFVAEMIIFIGAFQHVDIFHRVLTILVASSIVISAVYVLRMIGKLLFGPVRNEHHLELKDAKWFEKLSAGTLIVCLVGIGVAPLWLSNLISDSLSPILSKLMQFSSLYTHIF